MSEDQSQHVIIVGGGTAGITVAARLARVARDPNLGISLIEPSSVHYYQPAFTLVGGGAYSLKKTRRSEAGLIPKGVDWIKDRVIGYQPDNNLIQLESGGDISYDFLVVCPGLELNWDRIEGARATLGRDAVCSNYSADHAEYTWNCISNLSSGAKVLFTQPPLPFKCPGAPQKIAYLTADYLKKRGLLKSCELHFFNHGGAMFSVPLFAKELEKVAARYGINVHFHHNLVAVDGMNKKAVFEVLSGKNKGKRGSINFDMLHITPPQSPPESVKNSPLANEAGYIDVDQHTMQHTNFSNVFALGDACSTPNSKTAAAVRKQAPVVIRNLLTLIKGGKPEEKYDGYGSCPLTTAYGKVIMAEFTYGGKVTPTFPLDPRKERRLNWWIKTSGLPFFYWNYMLKGREWFFPHNTDYVEPDD